MLIIVAIFLGFCLVVRHKWRASAAKKDEILRLFAAASAEEAQIAKIQAFEEFNSLSNFSETKKVVEDPYYCAVCYCRTTTRCSRCKSVRYCSGKCQIIHWRQGHKDDCQPAIAVPVNKESEHVTETASEHQFDLNLNDEARVCSDPIEDLDDSGSSSSSSTSFFTSSVPSDTSFDNSSISDVHESGSPSKSDKASSLGSDSHIFQSTSDSDEADIPSPSHSLNSVSNRPRGDKVTLASKADESDRSTNFKDKRNGDGATALEDTAVEDTVIDKDELSISQSSSPGRTSSSEDRKNQAQPSTSKVMRSSSSRGSGNHQPPTVESKFSKSLKMSPSNEFWGNETLLCNDKETRSSVIFGSSGTSKKISKKAESNHAVHSETGDGPTFSQHTNNGLKTSVQKFVQHFRAPKQSKSHTFDSVKDSSVHNNHKVIFPPKLFMQLYSCNDVELHPFGLVNCGNSCYANAVLQCLTFTRPFTSYLLQGLHSKTCRKKDSCFICKLEHLIRKGQGASFPLSPVGLVSQIQTIGKEEDAHEFLRNVVDKMQSIFVEEAGVSGSVAEDSTLVGLTFGGKLRSKIQCMKCSGRSERFDRMMDLTVEIDGNIYTLEEALKQFTRSETLGGDDKYNCSRCKSYEKAKKKLTLVEAPNILTVVLKRFRAGNSEKLDKLIRFPAVLNLSPYMSGTSETNVLYDLYAVIVHLGTMNATYGGGHYVSYVKGFSGDWFKIDDSRVSPVDLKTVLSERAYILFYARHTPRGVTAVRHSVYSDGKPKSVEPLSSSISSKRKSSMQRPASSLHEESEHYPFWMSPNDSHLLDSPSETSSIFSSSDAGSYSTDSTKDSGAEEISSYIFGSTSLFHP